MLEFANDYPWLMALAIFLARVADVSLGTVRTIVVFRGYKFLAAAIGFCEILLWVMASAQVLTNLDAWYLAVAYAGGFAAGNYVGIWLESKLAMGDELVRAISYAKGGHLARTLREYGFDAIEMHADRGPDEPLEVVIVVCSRRRMPRLIGLIHDADPQAIYTINDVKRAYLGNVDTPVHVPFLAGWRVRGKRK